MFCEIINDLFVCSLFFLYKIAIRIAGPKQGEIYLEVIEDLQSGPIRFTEREQYLGILNQWADETGDRQIGRNIQILAIYMYLDSTELTVSNGVSFK